VRFIAANDNLDTANGYDILSVFRDVFNEYYVADTSKKIRAVKRNSALQGKAIGKLPYGYRTDGDDLSVWLPDEEAAKIVKEMFTLFTTGMGIADICRFFSERGTPTPEAHKSGKTAGTLWGVSSVCQMLVDPVYIGRYTSHKVTTLSYKNKKRVVHPESEWIVIENHHPPLVDIETFETAQRLRGTRRKYTKLGEKSILSGLVWCNDCGGTLSYARQGAKGDYPNFICKTYRSANIKNEHRCTRHGIRVSDLEQIVFEKIREAVKMAIGNEKAFAARVHKSANTNTEKLIKTKTAELGKAQRRIVELDKIIKRIYEDHIAGKFDDVRFAKLLEEYETEQALLTADTNALHDEISGLKQHSANVQSFMKVVERYGEIEELTEETARAFVEKVVVHEAVFATGTKRKKLSQQVDIHLTFIGQFNSD